MHFQALEHAYTCPWCWEEVSLLLDPGAGAIAQEFIEDCEVCCRPIQFRVRFGEEGDLAEFEADPSN